MEDLIIKDKLNIQNLDSNILNNYWEKVKTNE